MHAWQPHAYEVSGTSLDQSQAVTTDCQKHALSQKGYDTIWKRRGEIFESSYGSSGCFQSRMAPSCMLREILSRNVAMPRALAYRR